MECENHAVAGVLRSGIVLKNMQTNTQQEVSKAPRFKWLIPPLVWGMLGWFAFSMFHDAYSGVRDGHINLGGYRGTSSHVIERSHQPKLFWFGVALYTHLGLLVTSIGVWALTYEYKQKRRRSQTGTSRRFFHIRFVVTRPPRD